MNAETELLDLLEHWRKLTAGEAAAIGARDWAHLDHCQGEKKGLAVQIARSQEAVLRELRPGGPRERFGHKLQLLLSELVSLETQNTRSLDMRLQRLGDQQRELQQASHSLHRVRQAYATGSRPLWHSYS